VADAAAKRLRVKPAELHAWNLDAADGYSAPTVSFPEVVPMILAAEQPMGTEYAKHYAQLFDPAAHRVEWCRESTCDDAGFSIGYASLTSGLFYGSYQGSVDSMRAVAHEAGHAVHRQFMSESQPLAVYNSGPSFVFESFAIFNELLLLDHLYRSAPSPAAKAYYLHKLLDDVTFQVYGSAQETDLEESVYAGAQAGTLRTAADLDALTLQVFSQYMAAPALEPAMKVYWARNRLYFTDPFYDVNYLFAGLLALEYLQRYESDRYGFSRRYVALLKNGFTDTPQALLRKFLDIEPSDADGLVGNAATMISKRTAELESLYARP
jgi:oligoendopeptidase F